MPTVLITGANRGIGHEFAQQYAEDGWRVHACMRDPAQAGALAESGDVLVHQLDVTDDAQTAALAGALAGESIDVVINNAGTYGQRGGGFGHTDYDAWRDAFEVNTIAPVRIAEAFAGNLATGESKVLLNLSSRMGSIGESATSGGFVYGSSKAALNFAMRAIAQDLSRHGITVLITHPGWVQTEMGGAGAPVPVGESVARLRALVDDATHHHSGLYLDVDGSEIPW